MSDKPKPSENTNNNWNLFANPLFIKSCRARLRTPDLVTWSIVTIVITGFIFALAYFLTTERANTGPKEAAYNTVLPLLIIQGVILMLAGTGAVANGFATEKDSGVLDYHRLTPMSTTAKVLGYVFGLPIREYILFALTLPFMFMSIIIGDIPIFTVIHLYVLFFTAVIFYHMTGIVAGIVTPKAKKASVIAQFIVIILYFMALLRFAGFKSFEFLTIVPAVGGLVGDQIASESSPYHKNVVIQQLIYEWREGVSFYWFDHIPPTLFTLVIQGFLISSFFIIIFRKWRNDACHPITKVHAVIFFFALQLLRVGSFWPMIGEKNGPAATQPAGFMSVLNDVNNNMKENATDGRVKEGAEFLEKHVFKPNDSTLGDQLYGRTPAGKFSFSLLIFFVISTGCAVALINAITPDPHERIHAIRRASVFGETRLNPFSDASSNIAYGPILAVIFAAAYSGMIYRAFEVGTIFTDKKPDLLTLAAPMIFFSFLIVLVQAMRERFGVRVTSMFMFIWWLIPVFVWILILAAFGGRNDVVDRIANFLSTPSPLTAWFFIVDALIAGNIQTLNDTLSEDGRNLTMVAIAFNVAIAGPLFILQLRKIEQLREYYKLPVFNNKPNTAAEVLATSDEANVNNSSQATTDEKEVG